MPYIDPERRKDLYPEIEKLASLIFTPGELNYTVTRLLCLCLLTSKLNYHEMSRWRATLLDAADEFYRRVMGPHEDTKKEENGDVYDELIKELRQCQN